MLVVQLTPFKDTSTTFFCVLYGVSGVKSVFTGVMQLIEEEDATEATTSVLPKRHFGSVATTKPAAVDRMLDLSSWCMHATHPLKRMCCPGCLGLSLPYTIGDLARRCICTFSSDIGQESSSMPAERRCQLLDLEASPRRIGEGEQCENQERTSPHQHTQKASPPPCPGGSGSSFFGPFCVYFEENVICL